MRNPRLVWRSIARCLTWLLAATAAIASARAAEPVSFRRDVQPLLAQRCFRCHGPDKAEGGLRLSDRGAALAELESGNRAIAPGMPGESALLERISAADPDVRMPPEGKPLTADQIALVRRWIEEGAPWQKHWAFESPAAAEPPDVRDRAWVRNPIDAFILATLEKRGLAPAAPADPRALIRRLYYELTGLPPTCDEVDAFVADTSPDAYERAVDRLLDSPRYGERWGRHWLDLVRFAETNSFERDGVKPNAWKFRDYVIRSFNDDKPYQQFIREQLAGDELPEVTTESLIATGYYRLGLWDDEPADPLQARFDELDDIVATTAQVFLALTVNCARCHDHKLDPIPQTDYYKLLAFFQEVDRYGTESSQTDISPPEVAERHARLSAEKRETRQRMVEIEQSGIVKMSAEDQRKTEGPQRSEVLKEKLQACLGADEWRRYGELRRQMENLEKTVLPPRESVLSVAKCLSTPPETFVLVRGNPHVQGVKVEPGFPEVLGGGLSQIVPAAGAPAPGAGSSGRRRALADWIASPDNPLTARVLVNRVWQHHFGRGLVRSSSNFGSLGTPPTHPELLDWLAREFVAGGWRLKPLHKLIVTSAAYRMTSAVNVDALARDPENDLFWRFDMRRLGAEEIRDSILAVSGALNLEMYGPGVFPEISPEVLAGQSVPGSGWGHSSPADQARRSIYIHVKRSLTAPVLSEFDFCETDGSCAARFTTTQPAQALSLLNGRFAHQQAAALAARARREVGGDAAAQVRHVLRLAFGGAADGPNIERGLRLMTSLKEKHGASDEAALDYFCLMVLNLNELVYLD